MFPSSGLRKGTSTLLDPLGRVSLGHWSSRPVIEARSSASHLKTETDLVSETSCFQILGNGKVQNSVILIATHHCQNRLEFNINC
jgi:hypothetical protein